jgi:hypothetical protein
MKRLERTSEQMGPTAKPPDTCARWITLDEVTAA